MNRKYMILQNFNETIGYIFNLGYLLTPTFNIDKKIKDRGVEQSGSSLGS